MNCRPGDLAIIVRVGPATGAHLGKIVRVLTLTEGFTGLPAWRFESDRPLYRTDWHKPLEFVEDHCLRPIRGLPKSDDINHDEELTV